MPLPISIQDTLSALRTTLVKPEHAEVRRVVDYVMIGLTDDWLSVLSAAPSGSVGRRLRALTKNSDRPHTNFQNTVETNTSTGSGNVRTRSYGQKFTGRGDRALRYEKAQDLC